MLSLDDCHPHRLGAAAGAFAALLATAVLTGDARAQAVSPLLPPFAALASIDRSTLPDHGAATAPMRVEPLAAPEIEPPAALQRRIVAYATRERPGTLIVDTAHTYLYFVLGDNRAIRYGIGVGREGFTWSGVSSVARKAEWPDWVPPQDMISRQPYLPRWMAGGPGNPLGARALYLGTSIYRIHGTNDPSSIGKRVSSGCIRMTNDDVRDLYSRVSLNAKVVVLTAEPTTAQRRSKPVRTATATGPNGLN